MDARSDGLVWPNIETTPSIASFAPVPRRSIGRARGDPAGHAAVRPEGSSRHVDFYTTKTSLLSTNSANARSTHVVYDSDWEAAFAERLERIPKVRGYVKNHGLGFEVPYLFMGAERIYRPDFIVHWDDGRPDPLQLVVEIKGRRTAEDEAKADTLSSYWLPAVNNDGRFGRWGPA